MPNTEQMSKLALIYLKVYAAFVFVSIILNVANHFSDPVSDGQIIMLVVFGTPFLLVVVAHYGTKYPEIFGRRLYRYDERSWRSVLFHLAATIYFFGLYSYSVTSLFLVNARMRPTSLVEDSGVAHIALDFVLDLGIALVAFAPIFVLLLGGYLIYLHLIDRRHGPGLETQTNSPTGRSRAEAVQTTNEIRGAPPKKKAFKAVRIYAARLFGGLCLSAVICIVLTFVLAVGLGTGNPYVLAPFAVVVAMLAMVFSLHYAQRKTNDAKVSPLDFSKLTPRTMLAELLAGIPAFILFLAIFRAGEYLIGDIAGNISRISADFPTVALSFILYLAMALGMFAPSFFGLFALFLLAHWLMRHNGPNTAGSSPTPA